MLQVKAQDEGALHSDYMLLRTKGRGKTWTRRWFVLREDFVLYSFKTNEVCSIILLTLNVIFNRRFCLYCLRRQVEHLCLRICKYNMFVKYSWFAKQLPAKYFKIEDLRYCNVWKNTNCCETIVVI